MLGQEVDENALFINGIEARRAILSMANKVFFVFCCRRLPYDNLVENCIHTLTVSAGLRSSGGRLVDFCRCSFHTNAAGVLVVVFVRIVDISVGVFVVAVAHGLGVFLKFLLQKVPSPMEA